MSICQKIYTLFLTLVLVPTIALANPLMPDMTFDRIKPFDDDVRQAKVLRQQIQDEYALLDQVNISDSSKALGAKYVQVSEEDDNLDDLKNYLDCMNNIYDFWVRENRTVEEQRKQSIRDAIQNASYQVTFNEAGYCASYVTYVFETAGYWGINGNANDMYYKYCTSNNREEVTNGMIIAVPSVPKDYLGSLYGHVGIIVQHDGQYFVRQNVGEITEEPLDNWIAEYGVTSEPRWGCPVI